MISPLEMALQLILGVAGTSSLHPQDGIAVLLCALSHVLQQVLHHELLPCGLVLDHHVADHRVVVSQKMSQCLQSCQQPKFNQVHCSVKT